MGLKKAEAVSLISLRSTAMGLKNAFILTAEKLKQMLESVSSLSFLPHLFTSSTLGSL